MNMKKYSVLFITLYALYCNASTPWECLQIGATILTHKQPQVHFWHADRWLTQAYAFDTTKTDPFATIDEDQNFKFTPLGDKVNTLINHCGCTNSWAVMTWTTHVEGLCW